MKNIMKSIGYEILHSKMLIRIYILFIALMVLVTVLNTNSTGISGLLADNDTLPYEFQTYMVAIIVGIICGSDFPDKVANYEITSGHSRVNVFLARALMAICSAAILATVLSFVPILFGNVVFKWGNKLVLSDVVIRNLLLFFPYVRMAAFIVVLTFLVKNPYVIMASGFVMMMGGSIIGDMTQNSSNVFISIYNMHLLCTYDGWSTYNLDPVKGIVEYNAYNSAVTPSLVFGTIGVSLFMTAFYLFMGYALFRRDDMN